MGDCRWWRYAWTAGWDSTSVRAAGCNGRQWVSEVLCRSATACAGRVGDAKELIASGEYDSREEFLADGLAFNPMETWRFHIASSRYGDSRSIRVTDRKRTRFIITNSSKCVDDAIIGILGNFSASIGKVKSKKTFNVSAIAASALSGSIVLRYRSMFPENKMKILYIDTKQGRHHCQQVLKHILRCLAKLPDDKVPENLIMLSLRKFAPRVRLLIVEEAIDTTPDLGLVIIDGIRNFLYDINSSSEQTTNKSISILSCIRTKMMNMRVVTSARNSTTRRKPSCR